jgi:transposase
MLELKNLSIYVATQPIDFRASIDGLCMRVSRDLGVNPQKGIFVFYNRSRDKIKVLWWHHTGFILLYKRLDRGRFHVILDATQKTISIDEKQVQWLIAGMNWELLKAAPELSFAHYS